MSVPKCELQALDIYNKLLTVPHIISRFKTLFIVIAQLEGHFDSSGLSDTQNNKTKNQKQTRGK